MAAVSYTDIQDVKFHPVPEHITNPIKEKEKADLNLVAAVAFSSMGAIFASALLFFFLRPLLRFWYISFPLIAALIASVAVFWIRDCRRRREEEILGTLIHITDRRFHKNIYTFTVESTGQIVVDLPVGNNYCEGDLIGKTVLLLRRADGRYALCPPGNLLQAPVQ